MRSRERQQGLTLISWLIVLSLLVFALIVGIKVVPHYLEHFSVKQVVESLETEPALYEKRPHEIRKLLEKRFKINYITAVNGKDIEINKDGRVVTVMVDYQVKEHIVGNIDVLISFSERIEINN